MTYQIFALTQCTTHMRKSHIINQVELQLSCAENLPSTQSNVSTIAEVLAIGAQPCSMLTQLTDSDKQRGDCTIYQQQLRYI